MQGCERTEGMSKSETGLWCLSQGSQKRVWNGEGWAGSSTRSSENRTKVCGGYAVGDLRTSLGHGEVWIRVPVRCYTECNRTLEQLWSSSPGRRSWSRPWEPLHALIISHICFQWGDVPLCHQLYNGFPAQIKNEIFRIGKPNNLLYSCSVYWYLLLGMPFWNRSWNAGK